MIQGYRDLVGLPFAVSAFPAILLLSLWLGASPAAAVEPGQPQGMELIGVRSAGTPAENPQQATGRPGQRPASRNNESRWDRFWRNAGDFGRGLWHGARDALPNMWRAIRENPGTFLAVAAGIVAATVLLPASVVAVAGIALTAGVVGYGLYKSEGKPYEMGKVLGEAGFWTVAGLGVARGVTAVQAARAARAARSATAAETAIAGNLSRTAGATGRTAAAETTIASNAPRVAGNAGRTSLPVVNNPLCFVGGTPILTAGGERPIESLEVGDEVLTWSRAPRRASRGLAAATLLAMALGVPAPADATVASDALPVAANASVTFSTYRADGLSLGQLALSGLERGQLLRIGDRLWRIAALPSIQDPGFHLESTDVAVSTVSALFERRAGEVLELTARHHDGSHTKVTGTAEHPFYVPSLDRWIRLADLSHGLDVGTSSGRVARVVSVVRREEPQPVYNFEVAGTHNYFVGDAGDAPALLAHNQCHGDRLVGAAAELRAGARAGGITESQMTTLQRTVGDAQARYNLLRSDVRLNPGTAAGHANELRGVATGAQQTAAELRVLAAEARTAGNPTLAANLEQQIGQLERLSTGARRSANVLDRAAARLPDNAAIRAQAQSIDDAVNAELRTVPRTGPDSPRMVAGAADDAANPQAFVGRANRGQSRPMSSSNAPELRAMETPIRNFQGQMISQEQQALLAMTADDQIRFLRETRRYQLQASGANKPAVRQAVAAEEARLASLTPQQLRAELTQRFSQLEGLPMQTRMEWYANPWGGSRLPTYSPGNCAEWPALEQALAARRVPGAAARQPPGQGMAMSARDPATGLYHPPCVYCQFVAENLGIRIVH